jgi:hypothetical protein
MAYELFKVGETKNLKIVSYRDDLDLIGLLELARNLIHEGHLLLTHPLSGSIKPYETPFKSMALSLERGPLDFQSLQIIEDSIATARKFQGDARQIHYSEKIYDDFRLIDMNLIKSGIESINQA